MVSYKMVVAMVLVAVVTATARADGSSAASAGAAKSAGGTWSLPDLVIKTPGREPVIAATAAELARLRAAWQATGPVHEAVAFRARRADEAMKAPLVFPPEGGQHGQYYQCDKCQIALVTVDAHHHKCPICGTVYSGFPYDNVLYEGAHFKNIYRMEDAAWCWAMSGDKKYAEFAARVLLGYAERYLKYPMVCNGVPDPKIDVGKEKLTKYKSAGHIGEQTLNEAMLMVYIVTAYDLVRNSGVLSDDQKLEIESKLIRPMAECIDVNKAGKSNWQTWHNAALLWAGAILGDQALARKALEQPGNGFQFQMGVCVLPEGMWFENSWGYHHYALLGMTQLAEGARRLGADLYSNPMLKKMYLVAFDYVMADGTLPRFGDGVQDAMNQPSPSYEAAYAAYHDARLLENFAEKPSWESVMQGRDAGATAPPLPTVSRVFPGAGNVVLRTDGPGKLSAAMTFAPYGGFHGHFDKLSFVFFGYGRELAVDPGRAASQAYRLPIHKNWYRGTVGHNAVLVDGQGQKEADGKLVAFGARADWAGVTADAGKAFDGVQQRRTLILGPAYLLVVDQFTATDSKERSFDWVYHNTGSGAACDLPSVKMEMPSWTGLEYIKNRQGHAADVAKPIEVSFTGSAGDVRLMMAGQKGDLVLTGDGPFRSVEDRVPLAVVVRCGQKEATFVAVIEPLTKGSEPAVKSVTVSNGTVVRVELAGGRTDLVTFQGGPGAGTFKVEESSGSDRAVEKLSVKP